MELTDAELALLVTELLDDASAKIRHGASEYNDEEMKAFDTLSRKAHAEAVARRKAGNKNFRWAR
jgi:hypothetical protein